MHCYSIPIVLSTYWYGVKTFRKHSALVLAPFFVHLELLFPLGYKPELYKEINNLAAIELTRVRKLEAEKKRAKKAK